MLRSLRRHFYPWSGPEGHGAFFVWVTVAIMKTDVHVWCNDQSPWRFDLVGVRKKCKWTDVHAAGAVLDRPLFCSLSTRGSCAQQTDINTHKLDQKYLLNFSGRQSRQRTRQTTTRFVGRQTDNLLGRHISNEVDRLPISRKADKRCGRQMITKVDRYSNGRQKKRQIDNTYKYPVWSDRMVTFTHLAMSSCQSWLFLFPLSKKVSL